MNKQPKQVPAQETEKLLRMHRDREAYMLRKLGAEGLWKWEQQAITELAKLRPDLDRKRTSGDGGRE